MNPTDPNQSQDPAMNPMGSMPQATGPAATPADPMAQQVPPAPVEPAAPVEQPVSTPEPPEPVTGEQPVVGGVPSGDQGGQMPPTVPPTV